MAFYIPKLNTILLFVGIFKKKINYPKKMKGLNFPGSTNAHFCQIVLERSRLMIKPVSCRFVEEVRELLVCPLASVHFGSFCHGVSIIQPWFQVVLMHGQCMSVTDGMPHTAVVPACSENCRSGVFVESMVLVLFRYICRHELVEMLRLYNGLSHWQHTSELLPTLYGQHFRTKTLCLTLYN